MSVLRARWFACALTMLCACGSGDENIDITHSPCEPLVVRPFGASAPELESIADAVGMWNEAGADLRLLVPEELAEPPVDEEVELRFERAAPMFRGIYRDELGDVVINRSVSDGDRAIVVAHELGHAFGLEHTTRTRALMNPGNVDTPLRGADVEALSNLWPACELVLQ